MAISSEELFTCTFTYDVLADDVTAGRTPEITIKAQLDPPGDDPVQDVATAVYPGVEVFSSPVVRVKIASIDDFEPGTVLSANMVKSHLASCCSANDCFGYHICVTE